MAERELTAEEVAALGLERELSDEEARELGLEAKTFRGHGASGTWGYDDPGFLGAAAAKLGQGFLKDGADELAGQAAKALLKITRSPTARLREIAPGKKVWDRYEAEPQGGQKGPDELAEDMRGFVREKQGAADQHYPKLGTAIQIAGDVGSDVAAGAAGGQVLTPAYQVATGAARGYLGNNSDDPLSKAVSTGIGGTLGYGFSQIPGAVAWAADTAPVRAVANSATGKTAREVLSRVSRWPGEATRRFAARRATSAAGLTKKDLNKLPPNAATEIGMELLDRPGVIRAGRTAEELRPGILAARKEAGAEVGAIHQAADAVSGGSGAEVRRAVSGRRLADQNLRDAWRETDAMYLDAAQTGAAEDMAERAAFAAAEQKHLLDNALVTGKGREALAKETAESAAAAKFGERGTPEAFKAAGRLPADIARDRLPPVDPRELTRGLGFDAHGFADAVERRLLPELDDPVLRPLKTQVTSLLSAYRAKAARGLSHAEANAWKTTIQKTIRKFQDAPISQEAKIKLQGILDDEIEGSIAAKLGPKALPTYRAAKKSYGLLKDADRGNRSAIAGANGNQQFGMTELMLMSAGGTAGAASGGSVGSALGGAGLALGGHLLKHRGASAAAAWGNSLGKSMLAVVENAPHLLGEFGAVIAGQKTPQARAAMAEELALRYPAFAQMLEGLGQPDDGEASLSPEPTPRPGDPLRARRAGR